MKSMPLLIVALIVILSSLFTLTVERPAAAQTAAPETLAGLAPVYCNRNYLPLFFSPGGGAALQQAAPVAAQEVAATCAGFPDFNGDGYADLAVGVPNKEVFDGVVNQIDAGQVQVVYGSPLGLNTTAGERVLLDQIWHRALGGVDANGDDHYGFATIAGDFNDDGYDDLAVGIPGADIVAQSGAGAVQVIYGSPDGLAPDEIQEWSRDSVGDAAPEADDAFGTSLAAGDFNDDGYDDLAIGVPGANVGGDDNAGAVHILYGRSSGLAVLRNELLTQDTPGFLASPAEPADWFGFALAAADFNGDNVDDLATGTPYEDNGVGYTDAGSVQIFFGQRGNLNDGLIVSGSVVDPQHWRSDSSPYLEGAMEESDRFGFSLAAGHFDDDGYADLAVGIPYETHGAGGGALIWGGAVNVLYGGATGLEVSQDQPAPLWHQDSGSIIGAVATLDLFGWSLAAGDLNGDGYDDLAIGVPGDQPFTLQTGAVNIMYGGASGVSDAGNARMADDDNPEAVDLFGMTLHIADFDGNSYADLTVGAPGDEPTGVPGDNTGSVFVFYSDGSGVLQDNVQNWYPGNLDMRGTPAEDDMFGQSLPGSPRR